MPEEDLNEKLDAYDRFGNAMYSPDSYKIGLQKEILLNELIRVSLEQKDAPFALYVTHLFLMRPTGELIISQRAYNRPDNAGLWDKTGSHIRSGETPDTALRREALEELNLNLQIVEMEDYEQTIRATDLKKWGVVRKIDFENWYKSKCILRNGKSYIKRLKVATYAGLYAGEFQFKDGEVINTREIEIKELVKEMKKKKKEFTYDLRFLVPRYRQHLRTTPYINYSTTYENKK